MFNMYTKLATALGAFALLFSTGAWGQCAEGEVAIDYSISLGTYPSEISWQLNDSTGANVFTGGAGAAGTWCLAPGDYAFIGLDSYGDGWNGASATFTNAGVVIGTLAVSGDQGAIVLSVSSDVPGCTDPAAANYNPAATVDDGTCCLANVVTIVLNDAFGDGWSVGSGGQWGGFILNGDSVEYPSGSELSFDLCLEEGCYTAQISMGAWGQEASWAAYQGGVLINSGAGAGGSGTTFDADFFFFAGSGDCVVYGCANPIACNYDDTSNLDDGSCEFASCAGCIDPTACNYDGTATLDDGSCDFSCIGCLDENALNYCGTCTIDDPDACVFRPGIQYEFTIFDSYGDGICCTYGDGAYSVTLDGEVLASGGGFGSSETTSFCAEDSTACVVVSLTPDAYPGETSWQLINVITGEAILSGDGTEGSFATADCVGGCNDAGACNYDPAADINDGTCDYSCLGCTDPAAANYNPEATVDSGDCVFCDPGTFILTVDMADSFGDGWNGAEYGIFNETGTVYLGSLDSAFTGDGLTSGTDLLCLAPGCYTFQVTTGSDPAEISVTLSDEFGNVYGTIGGGTDYGVDFGLTGQCDFEGCTDAAANNYNPSASIDDGSCELPPANDDVANAEALACDLTVSGTLQYSNDNEDLAGLEYGNDVLGAAGVWYVINSDANQQITVSTGDTPQNEIGITDYATNTDIAIFKQDLEGNLTCIATNNDAFDTGFHSAITWTASTGEDYYIRVEGTGGNEFVIAASCNPDQADSPANDECGGAIAQVTGETFLGNTCGANAEEIFVPWSSPETAYGVYFTFNSSNYDTFLFNLTNVSNEGVGFAMLSGNTCDNLGPFVGCYVTGSCAGSVESFLPQLEPNTDYYFLVWTEDQSTCGDFEFTTTGILLGCTDETATNYNMDANQDDGSCDFTGVTAVNDTCGDAIALECNSVTTGSTGGSTSVDAPNGIAGCEAAPGQGVWYSFVGDGNLHTLSTCGSAIDSKINLLSADTVCGQFTCIEAANSSDGNGVCTLFDSDDVNITFISDTGVQYYVYVSAQDADNNPTTDDNGTFDLEFTCAPVLEGCTDAGACNYNPDANIEDGSCDIFSCVCPDSTGTPLQFYMDDSFGDGWNGANYVITDLNGDEVAAGNLDDALVSVDNDNFTGPENGYDLLCLQPGCYIVTVNGGSFPSEVSWELRFEDGSILAAGGPTGGITVSLGGAVCGCTDPGACNYDATATDEDGSCEFVSCAGCTDNTACNYDAAAIIDDGSCCSDNCVSVNLNDSFGDGWNGAVYILTDVNGTELGSGTITAGSSAIDSYCLADGCYIIEVTEGNYPSEITWSISGAFGGFVQGGAGESVTFNVGSGDQCVVGCDIACACNYNENTNISDVSLCVFDGCSGCTYDGSAQYDPAAIVDDGSCTFEFANPCPADLNGDGSVSTADLLEFLTAFGQICE
jgi:hypothetical protein